MPSPIRMYLVDDTEPILKGMYSTILVDWQRFIQHSDKIHDENELDEYQFAERNSSHVLLLCLDSGDLMIYAKVNFETNDSQIRCTETQVDSNKQVVTPIWSKYANEKSHSFTPLRRRKSNSSLAAEHLT